MKTIIARFQELKKPMDEIGEVDGEIVDANAIETALRSAGVALRNMQGEFRDFDDVIFELSEKWGSLDLMTQRYIATMAAGSRQQSRFIALVSNHARLMELTGYATNSAGAAAEQFAKTQESLQAKMNRLANAMGQFWTNLADSTVIKGAVDLATLFMNAINGIIKAFSDLPGVVGKAGSVFATFAVTLGGFKTAKGLIDGFFEHVVKGSLVAGRKGGEQLGDGINQQLGLRMRMTPAIVTKSLEGVNFTKLTSAVDKAISTHIEGMGKRIGKEIDILSTMTHSPGIMDELDALEEAQAGLTEQSRILKEAFADQFPEEYLRVMDKRQAAMLLENNITGDSILLKEVENSLEHRALVLEKGGIPALLTKIGLLQQENLAQAKGNVLLATKNILTRESAKAIGEDIKKWYLRNILMLKGAATLAALGFATYALTKAISAMIKKAKDKTLEGRMAAATERTKKAAEAANEAKEAYDRLLGDQDKYTELQNTLDGLTEGTEEWRDALIEANDQVLELLRNYPSLSEHMERDSQGRLIVSREGQRIIKEQGRQQVENAQMASLAAQLDQSILQREAIFKESLQKSSGGQAGLLRVLIAAQEKTDAPLFKGADSEKRLQDIANSVGTTTEALLKLEDSFHHFTTTMDKIGNQIEKQARLFFTSGLDPQAASSELGKSLSNIFSKGMFDSPIEERVKTTADSITFATGRALGASNVAKELMSKYEVVVSDNTSEKNVLKALYKAVTKQESIPEEIAKDNKALKQEIARVVEVNRISEDVKFLYNKILSFGEERADEFSALFSDGGKGFTQELADKISDKKGVEQYLSSIAEKWGFDLEEIADLMGISVQEMTDTVISNAEMDEKRRERANRIIEDRLGDHQDRIQALTRDMDSESYSALVNKLNRLFAANGDLPGVIGEIEKLLESVSPEKAKAVLREVMSTNWADKDLLEGLRKRLLELDDNIPKESLDIFISQMVGLNNAISAVDVTSFINSLEGIGKVIDEIRGKTDRIFSAALYDEIYKYDENLALANFERNLDGTYTYVGDSIKSLADELVKAFGPIEEKIAQEEQKLEASKILVKVEGLGDKDKYTKKFLQDVLKDLKGVDLSTLAVEGLNANLNVDALEDDAVEDILSKLFKIGEEQMIILDAIKALRGLNTATKYADWSSGDLVRGIAESTDTKSIEEMSNALIQQATAAKVTEIAIRKYQKEVQSTDKSVREAALQEFEFAIEIAKTVEKLEQFGSVASKHISDLEEMDEQSWAYKATLAELADEFNKVFETDLDETFFADKENFKNLELALQGNQEAWKKLIIEIDKANVESRQFVEDFDIDRQKIEGITNALDQLKFSITGEADLTALAHALIDAGVQIDQVAAAIEALGYMNVKFEMEYTWEKLWLNPNQYKMIKVPKLIQAASGTKAKIPAAPKAPSFRPSTSKGSKEKETDPWKNSYDWLYNLVQKTNKEIRDRNRMEQDLNRILEGRNVTAKDIYDNMEKQVRSLEKQRDLLVQQRSGRLEEKQRIEVEYANVKGYASYNEQIGYVEIDWNKLEKLSDRKGNNEEAERVDAYIKELERIADTMNSIDDSLYDIEDQIDDILKMGKDDYLNLEDRILNAVVQAQRDLIDEMSAIHDSMTNANARVLDRLQEGIAASRRVREDTKIESDISAKEARLALLRQDTSRANQLEIMRLEEELTQDRQDYTDKLIDDKITELQMQNDAAAEQRQMQIDLANDQLEMSQKYGLLWERVEKLTRDGVDIQGELIKGSELESLLRRQEGFLGMSEIQKMEWTSELENQLASAVAYIQANNRQQESIFSQLPSGNIAKEPAKPGESGAQKPQTPPSTGSGGGVAQTTSYYPKVTAAQVKAKGLDPNSIVDTLKAGGFASSHSERERIAKANGIINYTGTAAQNSQLRQLLNQGKLKRYKKGGLIDFTGPAWVDGSTTDPESILDAQDTRNLVALRDVLESLRRTGGGSGSSGDNYFDIRVQVDSLADDYDVDDLTNRIKKQIYDDATYRNVQVIRNLR